jgi:hypothetical protein
MNELPQQNSSSESSNSEAFRSVRQDSEPFGTMPNGSESFRKLPQSSEPFRTIPKVSERKENHTLTVREAARIFEAAGVARTERSIINWCQPNKMGIARLDHYFDPNERKYFISPQSVEAAIQEEKGKHSREIPPSDLDPNLSKDSETLKNLHKDISHTDERHLQELESQILDLKITNRVKEQHIARLEKEREDFANERQTYIQQLMGFSRKVGELETKLLRLEGPTSNPNEGPAMPPASI